ncbi:MAG TPA: endo-1,4-beta-xylanase, partial [Marinagarivorans sp.]|nr:endo-1,4-beta-xylanase [Marinagarivorans sp.]
LQELVDHHIDKMLSHYKGRITQWDVVNEPLGLFGQGSLEDNVFLRTLGPDYIARAFTRAHAVDGDAKLFLNEQFDRYTGPRAEAFINLVRALKDKGVPLHGVGLQHHMLFTLAAAQETKEFIERLAALGVEVEITELDARLRLFADEQNPHLAQAEYYRDIIKTCFDISACKGVTFWGLHDQDAWHKEIPWMFPNPNAPYLFDENKTAKIAVQLISEEIARWQPRGNRENPEVKEPLIN